MTSLLGNSSHNSAARTPARPNQRSSRKGSETLEFCLVLVPMLGFVFLLIDTGWAVFSRGALQYAVREGVRFAVTSQTIGTMNHIDSIKSVVQSNALGLLAGQSGLDKVKVRFFEPDTLNDITGTAGADAGGNLIEVSIEDYSSVPLLPLLRSGAPLVMAARSSDRMEATAAPGGACP